MLKLALPTLAAFGMALTATADTTTTIEFNGGSGGWTGPSGAGGSTFLDPTGGNPDGNMHTIFSDFGIVFRNNTNPDFVQDFSVYESVTVSVDLKVEDISAFGLNYQRPWLLEIRDFDNTPDGYPWVSVWYLFTWVGEGDWTTWTVTIADPTAVELPDGWGGYGA